MLQTAFYIIGIITMSLILILSLATVIGVFLIKKRIDHIHAVIEQKFSSITRTIAIGKKAVKPISSLYKTVRSKA